MATILSPSALLPSSNNAGASSKSIANPTSFLYKPPNLTPPHSKTISICLSTVAKSLVAGVAAAVILTAPAAPSLAETTAYQIYYGTAASAANYGGYGGNASKKDTAEYVYDVPDGWKERLVSKVEKGTNGTDSEFYNPKKRQEKEYLTYLAGFRQLAPKDAVLNNLALSDVYLQDLIASADSVTSEEKKNDNGQVYYVYEINGVGAHSLITVTCANNKLYAHFVNSPAPEWNRDEETLRHLHQSFKTIGSN
ncbi:thylakoid lumenal 19 kDa protein, chloroplastic [Impatiens glandulifera]|uniref:thylakoid lumenal 19 kDa protein, chloroplastic n=1 Tax=Impatiens glandulifera TaxID=253017 RepID=UPI001FB15CA4|nr:thylakoid lumenal 19 kDa protein, chloroplastic [Impatiens glandulifera]